MKKLLFLVSILVSANSFAITSRMNFEVRSCGVSLILDMRQQSTPQNQPMQQRQVVQKFEAIDCNLAMDDCDDERRQVQRQKPEQRGHLECQIQQQDNADYNDYGSGDQDPGDDDYNQDPKPPQSGGCHQENPCNSCDPCNSCPSIRECGENPFYNGGTMRELMNYRRCLRDVDACREGKPKDPRTGRYIWDDDK